MALEPKLQNQVMSDALAVGQIVRLKSDDSVRMAIIEIGDGDDPQCKVFNEGNVATYYLSQLAPLEESSEVSQIGAEELKARLTAFHVLSPSNAKLFSFRMGDINFVPYQYRPVLKLIKSDRPRLLVADEVGVGKTIETGLLLKELSARMDLDRVMIICPKPLISENKWHSEMKRFGESFTALDGKLLRHCIRETDMDGEWPAQFSRCIVPFSLFDSDLILGKKGKSGRVDLGLEDLDPPPQFDLIVVDEAHHARNPETFLNHGLRLLVDNAHAAVFLSATPVQLGSEDLFNLLNLLRPDLVMDLPSFRKMAEPNSYLNAATIACRAREDGWMQSVRDNLKSASLTDWGLRFIRDSPSFNRVANTFADNQTTDEERVAAIRDIEELCTFSSLINRTRRRDIGKFTTRKPETVRVSFTHDQERMHNELLEIISKILARCHGSQNVKFMMSTIRRQAASCLYGLSPLLENILKGKLDDLEIYESENDFDPETSFIDEIKGEINQLLRHARTLDPLDPKADQFVKVVELKVGNDGNNKCLIFSTFRHTLAYLGEKMRSRGIRFGVVHGGVGEDERRTLRSRFKFPKESPDALDVLLSSEVGCEGLDFQFCDMLINYDLPWNPMRIEQRIGRIDRFGQESEAVAVVNLITENTVDAEIYDRCLWRIGVFQRAIGGSEEILGEISKGLYDLSESFSLTEEQRSEKISQLADNAIRRVGVEKELEESDSHLFGLDVPQADWEQEIEKSECTWLSPEMLEKCVMGFLRELWESENFSFAKQNLKTLTCNDDRKRHLLTESKKICSLMDEASKNWLRWLEGSENKMKFTFDQVTAKEEKVVHLNVLHPLVRIAAHSFRDVGRTEVNLIVNDSIDTEGPVPFSIHSWKFNGAGEEHKIVAISTNENLERLLPDLLLRAMDNEEDSIFVDAHERELNDLHYRRWATARAKHVEEHKKFLNRKLESLINSYQARISMIRDKLRSATNQKILRMREGELKRVESDFENRKKELNAAMDAGDIQATLLFRGVMSSRRK